MTETKYNHRPPKPRVIEEELLDEYYTPAEVAELLKLHYNTVRRMIRLGELPAVKVGRGWRITKSDLEELTRAK